MIQRIAFKRLFKYEYLHFWAAILLVSMAFIVYFDTVLSMVQIWMRSETYTHCFLIFPISLYLAWRKKEVIKNIAPSISLLGLLSLIGFGTMWLLARLVDVAYFEQFALIGIIVSIIWGVLGTKIALELFFPLIFLFFSVPGGEFLIPTLVNFTADFTYNLVKLVGIPIYREGASFSLPSGDWSVVEACSGLRYLIASITLGTLFAYLNYNSYWYRFIFILASIITPIIANGLRAFMIVMIGHFSGMTLAVGVDHIIYGWVFFGLVMAALFWVGSFWAEGEIKYVPPSIDERTKRTEMELPKQIGSYGVILLLLIAAPLLLKSNHIDQEQATQASMLKNLPSEIGNWRTSPEPIEWEPSFVGYSGKVANTYTDGKNRVKLIVLSYASSDTGTELISSQNALVQMEQKNANLISANKYEVKLDDNKLTLNESMLSSYQYNYLVWNWYWIANLETSSQYIGKVLEAKQRIFRDQSKEAVIFLVTDVSSQTQYSAEREGLNQFLAHSRSILIGELSH